MEYNERDYLISLLRTGIFLEGNLKIIPATLEQIVESHYEYQKSYDEALNDQLMTHKDLEIYMGANGLWTNLQEQDLMTIKKRIDNVKLNMYTDRVNPKSVEKLRKRARAAERAYQHLLSVKNAFYVNSCEGFAEAAKVAFILTKTVFINDKPVDKDHDINDLMKFYNQSMNQDNVTRELARSEPWKSLWISSKHVKFNLLFMKEDQDLTINQRNIILWSTTYDNIMESYEPPEHDVIEDDDLLDGWFVYSRKKREEEKKERDKENNKKSKTRGSVNQERAGYSRTDENQEEFILVNQDEGWGANEINELNSPVAKQVIAERQAATSKAGKGKELRYYELPDVQEQGQIAAMRNMGSQRR
jgi:hypothetical protein